MAEQQIRFYDGAAYERMMGVWSRLAGEVFIDWLAPRSGVRWIDIGCGTGAFTELLVERCAPAEVQGSIRRRRSSSLRVPGPLRASRNFARATPWRCPSPTTGSMQQSWRW